MNATSHIVDKFVDHSYRLRPPTIHFLVGFFDDAAQHGSCDCGVVLRLDMGKQYHLWWHSGFGSNTRANIIALWGLLWFA